MANKSGGPPLWSVHPPEDAFEEYAFNRIPKPYASWLENHALACEQCRPGFEQAQLSVRLIKHALEKRGNSSSNSAQEVASKLAVESRPIKDVAERFKQNAAPTGDTESRLSVPQYFSPSDLVSARSRLPVSHLIASRCLTALRRENADLQEIEAMVSLDPGLAAHLMKLANSALLYSGRQIRSIGRALMQIGFQRTRLHILGLSMKASFASPPLQKLWNHSVGVAETARRLAELSQAVPSEEACLAGLVHDIGHLVLAGLGKRYETAFSELRKRALNPIEIEWRLCGCSHAQIGADLLEDWLFPEDMGEAVRHHHAPSLSGLTLTSLLFLAESWAENDEDVYDPIEHAMALRCLGLTARDLQSIRESCSTDLEMLRFAA